MKERILDTILSGLMGLIVGIVVYNLCVIAAYTQEIYELLQTMV